MTYALDTGALLRCLDSEAGADKVQEILNAHLSGTQAVVVSAIHWGEVVGVIYRRNGRRTLDRLLSLLEKLNLNVVAVTRERALHAAILKSDLKIPYADAFGVELAQSFPYTFVTADYDLKPAANRGEILFLPRKWAYFYLKGFYENRWKRIAVALYSVLRR